MGLKLNGATSGSIELGVPAAIGSDLSMTLPATAGEISVKGTDGSVDLGNVNIDSSGRLLVGTSSAGSSLTNTIELAGAGTIFDQPAYQVYSYPGSSGANTGYFQFYRSASGTLGTNSLVAANDRLGLLRWSGADGTGYIPAAEIYAEVDGAPGSNDMPGRLVFSTTADGGTSTSERMRISQNGALRVPAAYTLTTGNAANCSVQSDGTFQRSTSSIKYKTNVEDLDASYADALLSCRPVWYRSTSVSDNPNHSYWGFIAEEVAQIDPRLVHWKTVEITYDENGSAIETPCDPEPEGVQYDRFVPHLLNLIKRQQAAIETLEAKVAALEANP